MTMYRIGPITVATIGTTSTLIAVSVIVYLLILPAKKNYDAARKRYFAAAAASPGTLGKANQELVAAKNQAQRVKVQWAEAQATLMPPYDVSNRVQAMDQLTYELTQNLGPDLEYHLRSYHGRATAQFTIPAPPATPNAVTNGPYAIPLGTVTSRGSLQSVLNQFRDWRYFNRVVLLDNLALHGNSPFIQATYTATVYLLPQNDDKLPPPIPQAGGGPAGTATAGAAPVIGAAAPTFQDGG